MDHQTYRKITLDILSDTRLYRIMTGDPTNIFKSQLESILVRGLGKRLISENDCKFILPSNPQISTFYTLPNIHEGISPLKGRPVVSGVNYVTQKAGIHIDKVLRQFVLSLLLT